MATRPLTGAAKAASERAKANPPKPAKVARSCGCGCGEQTKGGEFYPGHDARHKSALIKEAKANNPDALAELDRRNWTRFLDKSREADAKRGDTAARRARGERVIKTNANGETVEAVAKARVANMALVSHAIRYLQAINRYGRSAGDRRLDVMSEGAAEAILANEHPEFTDSDRRVVAVLIEEGL